MVEVSRSLDQLFHVLAQWEVHFPLVPNLQIRNVDPWGSPIPLFLACAREWCIFPRQNQPVMQAVGAQHAVPVRIDEQCTVLYAQSPDSRTVLFGNR